MSVNGAESATLFGRLDFPPEVWLHILSYLDLPDLVTIGQVVPSLAPLTEDPVLHQHRLKVVSPSRINHNLFGRSAQGHALRPTIGDLVHRGVMKGLGIERRWRMGAYFYSLSSIIQYENWRSLSRRQASHVVSLQLRRRTEECFSKHHGGCTRTVNINGVAFAGNNTLSLLQVIHLSHVLPYIESSSLNVARSLIPVMRKLKWCIQKDKLAKVFKSSSIHAGIAEWITSERGRRVIQDGEKVRLATCPDIRKRVGFYEELSRTT